MPGGPGYGCNRVTSPSSTREKKAALASRLAKSVYNGDSRTILYSQTGAVNVKTTNWNPLQFPAGSQ